MSSAPGEPRPGGAAAPGRRRRLDRASRIRERRGFLRAFRRGGRAARKGVLVYATPNGSRRSRLGISIGRKFGKAVRRNRVRRLIKEAFRLEREQLPSGYDVVVVPQKGWEPPPLQDLRPLIAALAREAAERFRLRRRKRRG